jgi:hypothetical protein
MVEAIQRARAQCPPSWIAPWRRGMVNPTASPLAEDPAVPNTRSAIFTEQHAQMGPSSPETAVVR